MILALILLAVSIAAYSISQLQQHSKLRWSKESGGFWSNFSWTRKYKSFENNGIDLVDAPNTWYYRFFKIKYKERFPLSATFLVNFTDGYHACQSLSFLSLAGCVYVFSGINFLIIWGLILLVHFTVYRVLQK
jgi:hypothetical protein